MGYPETYSALDRWRDELRRTQAGDALICAMEERIARESDPTELEILLGFLAQEHIARGDQAAADAVLRRDPVCEIHLWYDEWRRTAPEVDVIPALEERIRNESDQRRLHALRYHLALEHQQRSNYAAAEAAYLADAAANPDEPLPLIFLAGQKLYHEGNPHAALPVIDQAVAVAMRAGIFRRHALATKARIALELGDYRVVEDVLRQIMALTFTRGNSDIGAERDILDRLPPGSIDDDVARAYDEYCRGRGKTRTHYERHADGLVVWAARPDWRKVARIMADVLNACRRNGVVTNEDSIAESIRLMVEHGKLEAQGDLSRWRHSEVRLPDPGARGTSEPRDSSGEGASATHEGGVVIASRDLTMTVDGGEVAVPVKIYAPADKGDHWRCEFEIGWPDRTRRGKGYGIDSTQALLVAMQSIGVELYTSEAHNAGRLKWDRPRGGYGFPLRSGVSDLYEGDDKRI